MAKKINIKYITIFLSVVFVYSLLFSFLFNYLTVDKIDDFDLKFKNVQRKLIIDLPGEDTYLIKIWGLYYPEKIYFNKVQLSPFTIRERGELKEVFVRVENTLVNKGVNLLNIISNYSYSVRVKNFYGATDSKSVYVLFNTSRFLKFNLRQFPLFIFPLYLFIIFLCFIFYLVMQFIFVNFDLLKFFRFTYRYNFMLLLFFLVFLVFSALIPYRIVFTPVAFLSLFIFLWFLIYLILYGIFINMHSHQLILTRKITRFLSNFMGPSLDTQQQLYFNFFIYKFFSYVDQIPGRQFIFYFIFLLFICMPLLIFKLYSLANWISYLAYFCLATGLGIKFVKLIKENR